MSDRYDEMDLDALHTEAVRRILHAPANDADCNVQLNAFAVIEAMGEARGNNLYKCGCTLTAYPHDGCYSCEFYKVKFGYENKRDYHDDVAGSASDSGSYDVGLPGVIFKAALRALDWDGTQELR